MNFWQKLKRPIIGLSPMDGVTDAPMRFITAKYGRPDVIFTEFVSADGIAYEDRRQNSEARIQKFKDLGIGQEEIGSTISGIKRSLKRDFKYDEIERPIVAQLFGGDPKSFFVAAKLVVGLGFDGVDINMGCPARKVAGRGEGAGLIKNPSLAAEIIAAVKAGVKEATKLRSYEATNSGKNMEIPVSVKTRIGYDEPEPAWWEFLSRQDLAAVTIHGRTFKQLYQGKADWEAIGKAAKVIKSDKTIFLGNGDVENIAQGSSLSAHFGTDGVLIGRGAQGNPWVFQKSEVRSQNSELTLDIEEEKKEKLAIAIEHSRKFEECFPNDRFFIMRKHLSWYARGFDNASDLRNKLVLCNNADEVEQTINEFIK